jgi:hypothetical protein
MWLLHNSLPFKKKKEEEGEKLILIIKPTRFTYFSNSFWE